MIRYILLAFLAVFAACALAIFGVDFYLYLVDRYCRFHIGRWKNRQEWKNAIYRVARKWARRTPTVKITDNARYVLLDMLRGKYRSQSIQSWQNAAIILGLWENGSAEEARKATTEFIKTDGNWKKQPVAVDSSMLAYAILKVVTDPESVRPAMDTMISIIENHMDDRGLISYTGGNKNPERYVDTLGLVCPFLALYAKTYQNVRYSKIAFEQLEFYHDFGLFADSGLPNHAIHGESKLPLGVYGWGRGTVWYTLGLVDTYAQIMDENMKKKLADWIMEAANRYRYYQRPDGGFGSILQRMDSYDSSATAGLAYFYTQAAQVTAEPDHWKIADDCLKKLQKVTRISGKIDMCQGDTKGIGIFAQTYDIMPFAQGLALRALAIHERNSLDG